MKERNCICVFGIPGCPSTDKAIRALKDHPFRYFSHTYKDGVMATRLKHLNHVIDKEVYPKVVAVLTPKEKSGLVQLLMTSEETVEWAERTLPAPFVACTNCAEFGGVAFLDDDLPILSDIAQAAQYSVSGKDFVYVPTAVKL